MVTTSLVLTLLSSLPLLLQSVAQSSDKCQAYSSQVSSLRSNNAASSYCTRYLSGTGSYTRTVTSTTTTAIPTSTTFQRVTQATTVTTVTSARTSTYTSTTTLNDCSSYSPTANNARRQWGGGGNNGGGRGGGGGNDGWGDNDGKGGGWDDGGDWGNGSGNGNGRGNDPQVTSTLCNCILEKTVTKTSTATTRTGVATATTTFYTSATSTIYSQATATTTICVPYNFTVYVDEYKDGSNSSYASHSGLLAPDSQSSYKLQLRNGALMDAEYGLTAYGRPFAPPSGTFAVHLLMSRGLPEGSSISISCSIQGAITPPNSTSYAGTLNCGNDIYFAHDAYVCPDPTYGDLITISSGNPGAECYPFVARPKQA